MSIRIAVKIAQSSVFKQRVGAVVAKNGRILAIACNAVRHKQGTFKKAWINSLHAEQAAMLQVDCKGADLYVVRLLKNGELSNACPCLSCRDMIFKKGIRNVYYSNEYGDIVKWKVDE